MTTKTHTPDIMEKARELAEKLNCYKTVSVINPFSGKPDTRSGVRAVIDEDKINLIAAALAEARAVPVEEAEIYGKGLRDGQNYHPDGWKLVPVEPTNEMLEKFSA